MNILNAIQYKLNESIDSECVSISDEEAQSDSTIEAQTEADCASSNPIVCENQTQSTIQCNMEVQTDCAEIELCAVGTQTTIQSGNMQTQTDFGRSTTATQTTKDLLPDNFTQAATCGTTVSTQTDVVDWLKIENQLALVSKFSKRLGDEVVDSSDCENEAPADLSHDEETFSDASETIKQFDNQFTGQYGYITNVCVLYRRHFSCN